jgi:pilus assembly protein CpaE
VRLLLGGLTEPQLLELRGATQDLAEDAGHLGDWTLLEEAVGQARPDVVGLHLGVRPSAVLQMITRVRALYPAVAFLAITDLSTAGLVQKATEAGCADLVVLREGPADLRRALVTLQKRDRPPTADGSVVTVIGAKGGVGATTVAVHLADALAQRRGRRVIVVDLHLYMGDVASQLDLRPKPGTLWFLLRGAVADARTWNEAPPQHAAGFRVLGLDGDLRNADPVSAEQVVFLLERLKERYEVVVVDAGSEINEVSLAACSVAEHRLIVTTEELMSRTGVVRRREALKELELGPTPLKAVLNRAHPSTPEAQRALETSLGVPLVGRVANAWAELQAAQGAGLTLRQANPKSPLIADFSALGTGLFGGEAESERKKRTFFNFFR